MKEAMAMIVGIVITLVSLVSFMNNTFVPYKEQQATMAQSNTTMLNTLTTVMNESVASPSPTPEP